MPHFRTLLSPTDYLGPQDFPTERTVKISRVVREALPERDGKKDAAPMLYVLGKDGSEYPRRLKLPKSVLYGLSLLLGTDTDDWKGKDIALFATRCLSFGEVEECVRVRFPPEIDKRVRAWLKKRKASPSVYMIAAPAEGGAA